MKNEDKELLLKDLCSRLPYKVKGKDCDGNTREMVVIYPTGTIIARTLDDTSCASCGFIPYLRPMYSMTEEESAELSNIISKWFDNELFYLTEEPALEYALSRIKYSINPLLFDWLNERHFDYRGLIEKGLAIEAPEDMYK